jgi:nitrate reductase alpha subunit
LGRLGHAAHLLVDKGAKSVVITPDYAEAAKFGDLWLHPKQGTDAALAMAMGHVILKEFHLERETPSFRDYVRTYTDMPMLVRLKAQGDHFIPERFLRASDLEGALGEANNPEWKTVALDETTGALVCPQGSVGYRWGENGKWNLEPKEGGEGREVRLALSLLERHTGAVPGAFPYFGSGPQSPRFTGTDHPDVLLRNVPAMRLATPEGEVLVATVHDLTLAHYGLDRGLGGDVARSYEDDVPYTPAWQERITGVPAASVIAVAREFAENAEKTCGKSMVILGAGVNHWYHMDMIYRGIINLLVFCGCVGQEGGG